MKTSHPALLISSAQVALASALSFLVSAAEIHLKPSSSKPLVETIASATAGDTLILETGVYHERVRVDKALTIRAEPGTILEGSAPLKAVWSPAAVMKSVFVANTEKRPEGLLVGGRFIAEIRFDRAEKSRDCHWRALLTNGMPLSGFGQVRALWMYHPKEKRIYVRLENGASPETVALSAVMSRQPLLEIVAPGVVVEGLTFAAGVEAVRLDEGAKDCVIRRCRVTSYEGTGILITGGASNCTVEDCEITRGALEEWQPTEESRRENYEIWKIHKDLGKYDRIGIEISRAGVGNRILRNRLDRVFDGICLGDYRAESLDKPPPDPEYGRGTEIAGNVIENTRDSGIELGVGCVEVNVHHNTLRRTHGGLRFKVPRIGPVFIHHNQLIDGTPFNIWFSMDSSTAEGYVYHNTITGGGFPALIYSSFNAKRDFATPKWHFLNNLTWKVKGGFFEQRKGTPPRDFKESNNITTDDATTAIDAGLDLSTHLKGKPLPGCEPGYFQGKAPDAGAEEAATPGAGTASGVRPRMIEVDAAFPGGNIMVDSIVGDVITVHRDVRDTTWDWFYYYFRVRGAAGRSLTVNFTQRDPMTSAGPAVSTDGGTTWQWLGNSRLKRFDPPARGVANADQAIRSSFRFDVPEAAAEVRFCLAMPYMETDLKEFLQRHKHHPNLRVDTLCKTRKGRSTEALHLGRLDGRAKVRVLITARHHSCEMMASHALEGIMESILAEGDAGKWLREHVEFLVIPFMDKDGVEDGDQGKNRKPWDHNRDYSGESIYPSVAALRARVPEWSAGRLRLALDLHCPGASGAVNEVIYGLYGSESIERLARILETVQTGPLVFRLEDYLPHRNDYRKWSDPTPTNTPHLSFNKWARELPGGVVSGLIELPYAKATGRSVTADSATRFGHDLAKAMQIHLAGLE